MPHVLLKLASGRSEDQKKLLAQRLMEAVVSAIGSAEDSVSVSIEDVPMADWAQKVFVPEIQGKPEILYKKPGYDPFKL